MVFNGFDFDLSSSTADVAADDVATAADVAIVVLLLLVCFGLDAFLFGGVVVVVTGVVAAAAAASAVVSAVAAAVAAAFAAVAAAAAAAAATAAVFFTFCIFSNTLRSFLISNIRSSYLQFTDTRSISKASHLSSRLCMSSSNTWKNSHAF